MLELLLLFGLAVGDHVADPPASSPSHELSTDDEVVDADTEPAVPAVPPILEAIAQCESGGAWHGQDGDLRGTAPRSSASGRWWFIDSTWRYVWSDYLGIEPPTARAKHATPAQQTRAAVALHQAEGTTPWNASRSCWGGS